MIQATLEKHDNGNKQALYMACDLSLSTWKLAFGIGGNPRIIQIPARDLKSLSEEIAKAKKRFGLREEAGVVSCYEAGRDGFWIHRHLLSIGVLPLRQPGRAARRPIEKGLRPRNLSVPVYRPHQISRAEFICKLPASTVIETLRKLNTLLKE